MATSTSIHDPRVPGPEVSSDTAIFTAAAHAQRAADFLHGQQKKEDDRAAA